MGYFRKHKIGKGSSKHDCNPEALDIDINNSRNIREQFREDFLKLLDREYYIEKVTSHGQYLATDEKIDIIIEEIYKIRMNERYETYMKERGCGKWF